MDSSLVRRVRVVVFGLGGVGRALVRQLSDARPRHAAQHGVSFAVVAVADSSGVVFSSSGRGHEMGDDELRATVRSKEAGARLADVSHAEAMPAGGPAEVVRSLTAGGSRRVLAVDCSASAATAAALAAALASGGAAATANKKPVTDTIDVWDSLMGAGVSSRFGAESSVGAGTPMVAAARRLVAGGDDVRAARGCFSGTLGYLCSGLQAGETYSAVVRRAHGLGYTEPDPRDDLGGTDVARKALILARIFGARLEMSDVAVEPLYPADMAGLTVPEFLEALPRLDAEYSARTRAAAEAGSALRYVASVEILGEGRARVAVGLKEVPLDSPLGGLTGTANMVEFSTRIYGDEPLVVQGSGAGVEITAAGVIADMVGVSHSMDSD